MSSQPESSVSKPWSTPIGHLRAWVTMLVVAHHAVLAYHQDAPPMPATMDGANRIWGAFPIVDSARFPLFGLFTWANEMYFMALMFLLSGLFVWPALKRKGAGAYVCDRVLRLGVPFAISAGLLAPLAYHATWMQMGTPGGWPAFWAVWTKPGMWMSGPAWFLWVLLSFDLVVAAITAAAPRWGDSLGALAARLRGPGAFFGALFAVASVGYLVLELWIGGLNWWTWGPFTIQGGRTLLYFAYFVTGIALGARPLNEGVLAEDGALARQWKRWANIAGTAFALATAILGLTFLAARRWLGWSAGTLLLLDIGGGSLELGHGMDEEPDAAVSVPLGAGRVTRNLLPGDPPAPEVVREARKTIRATLAAEVRPIVRAGAADHAVGTSKTFRSLARLTGAAPSADGPYVRRVLNRDALGVLVDRLARMPVSERVRQPGVSVERAPQVLAGALVAEAAMDLLRLDTLEICPWALREGVILRRLEHLAG